MRSAITGWLLVTGALFTLGRSTLAAETDVAREEEQLLKAAHVGTDGPALLAFFRARTGTEATQKTIQAFINQLGDRSDKVRLEARAKLTALGRTALPLLQAAIQGSDQEVKRHAATLIQAITQADSSLPAAAARLVAVRKPAGAAAVLLAYVPFADDDLVAGEVRAALSVVAVSKGKPDRVLVAALEDRDPICRAVAAEVLCQARVADRVPGLAKLLHDPVPKVRLRVALALAAIHEAKALPILIDLLGDLPSDQGRQAEEALLRLAGRMAPRVVLLAGEAGRKKCKDAWGAWWRAADGNSSLDYFRRHTLTERRREKILALVNQLGDRSYRARKKAVVELIGWKKLAVPFLKDALNRPDLEIRRRAEKCLKSIAATPEELTTGPHARLLALRRPNRAAEVLLAYLPSADDDDAIEQVRAALVVLARADKRANKVLRAALDDRAGLRRLTAAEALCQAGTAGALPAVARLLDDAEPLVRLRVALALSVRGEKKAVPVLIALLADLAPEQLGQTEEILRFLAGPQAPNVALGNDEAERCKCHDAWNNWWEENKDKVDMARLLSRPATLGYTLVAQWNFRYGTNEVIELGRDRKPRWQITGLQYSFDFDVLPGGRLLAVEHLGHRVTERNVKGTILWEYKVNSPINCQRLPNGHTFIATPSFVIEVDRTKKEILKINKSGIMAGQKAPDGRIMVITSSGQCIQMDRTGKELTNFSIGSMSNYGGIEALSRGRVLVASHVASKVVEYDAAGKVLWTHAISGPGFATRLANGNTLITSQGGMYAVEVTRAGKVVWEYHPKQAIWRARRR